VILARVLGNVVSSQQHPAYNGKIVLICQPVEADTTTRLGTAFLACDSVQAGPGDLVVVAREGNAARQVLGGPDDPFHAVVLGIVDEITLGE
jgi:ethanolamine utilization protein EutN